MSVTPPSEKPASAAHAGCQAVTWSVGVNAASVNSAFFDVIATETLVNLVFSDRGFGFSILLNPVEAARLASLLFDKAREVSRPMAGARLTPKESGS